MRLTSSLTLVAALIAAPLAAQSTGPVVGPVITTDARTLWFDNMKVAPHVTPGPLQQASGLLAQGRYAEADDVLDNVLGATRTNGGLLQLRLLKGVAALGQDHPETARRLFKKAASMRRSEHPGALTGLALAEIQLGDQAAAQRILDRLESRRDACDAACPEAKALGNAVGAVQKALSPSA
ncbi:tetratricopeptide repeat protein [Novosphingobium aquimarinum]|uniref:tetratricopeptide repeat protein n=1 Tax=Novosphingobium aquimarinum TaxID=2682494 RepID=UPI0012EB95C0|nr:tetratricopeptide repeat protein [Novosphingobium aquimarinum]